MKTIRARLTAWYAFTSTATLAVLFVAGYFLLQNNLIHGLDLLNAAEFEQIRSYLGTDLEGLDPFLIDERIRSTTDHAKTLFYIDVHKPGKVLFRSTNLEGRDIPDVKGEKKFNVVADSVGALRVGEFLIPPFDVMIGTPLLPVYDALSFYVKVCVVLLGAMLVASIVIGLAMSRLVLRPVRAIRETALRIGSDRLDERVPVAEVKDEISDLARLLNQMFDRLAESFDQIRRFTADASHELKTPLSLVRLHAEKLMINSGLSQPQRESVQVQLEELARLNQIIEELLFLSRADARAIALSPRPFDPAEFLREFAQDAGVLAEDRHVRFERTHRGSGRVDAEANRLRQVLMNLLSNALKVSPPGSAIVLDSELVSGTWRMSLTDQGPGLDAGQRDRMFDRFVRFASDADDRGSGLGLAICRSIVELHGGRIVAEAGPDGRGLRVVIEIPVREDLAQPTVEIAEQNA